MSEINLTATELQCLHEVARHHAGYFWKPATCRRLATKGMVEMRMLHGYHITDAGRAHLAAAIRALKDPSHG